MARSGRFGRAPRTAPSLTSTLIAIAREYQQTRDNNIMDAWQKGGTFEGKKVTDDLVLAHWKERMNGVSVDDPLHDTYQNAVTNLDYTIHESKMTASYALKKTSDSQMVAFYLGWSKKVPKDSEFYRVLQRDAGQYMRSAKNVSQAAIEAAKEKKYQDQQSETSKKYEAAGSFLTDTMRRLNQSGYADGGIVNTIEAPDKSTDSAGQDLTSFDPSDPEVSMKLLALLTPYTGAQDPRVGKPGTIGEGSFGANGAVLYHSDSIDKKTGKPKAVTGADILAQLTKYDPSYKPGQPVDVPYLTGLLDRQNTGLQERIDRANKTGHMTDAANLTKEKGYIANLTRQVAAWPIEKVYQDLKQTWEAEKNDPTISPQALTKAWSSYQQGLYGLAKDPRIASNDNMRTRLTAEANGDDSTPTLGESFTGQDVNMTGFRSKDTATTQGTIKQAQDQIEAVTKSMELPPTDPSKVVWTYGTTKDDGTFVPSPNGTEIGTATMQDVNSSGLMPQTVTIPDARGGAGIQMVVTAVPVKGVAKDPVTGKDLAPTNDQPIAYAYNFPQGGQNGLRYGYLTKDPADPTKSVMNFSDEKNPPWNDKLTATPSSSGGNHYEVDFSPLIPTAPSTSGGAPGSLQLNVDTHKAGAIADLPGFNVADVPNPSAQNPHPVGTLVFDPYGASRASDVERNSLGGTDPATDFISLTVANLMTTEDGRGVMRTLDQHPEFKGQVTFDNNTYAGVQVDEKGVVINPGNPAKLAQTAQQTSLATSAKSFTDFVEGAAKTWQRMTTGSPYPGSTPTTPGMTGLQETPLGKLATDLVKGTPFEAIGAHLFGGTLTAKPPETPDSKATLLINAAKSITVPKVPEVKTVTTHDQTTGPSGGATSAQNYVQPQPQPQPTSGGGGGAGPKAL
jgi:hypothetical protein